MEKEDTIVSQQLQFLRVNNAVPRNILARLLGISIGQYSKYEMGVNRICAAKLYKLAKFFEVPLERFFEDQRTHAAKTL